MIDVHSHIVYGVDDGSKNLEDSIIMLKEAKNAGFTDIIATPHYMEGYFEHPKEDILNRMDVLRKETEGEINIFQGNEIYITNSINDLIDENLATTLNDSKYVLFELPMLEKPMNLIEIVYKILESNRNPIIAHPERYTYVQENPNILLDLIEEGVLFQSNYASIIGTYGKNAQKTVRKLLQHNMIHFLGSDNHRKNTIYANMPNIINELEKVIDRDTLQALTLDNPKCILENREIEIYDPIKIKEKKFFNLF